jgi:CRP/FNR family transcriptional regulator, cyclic AMP receptor protein
MTHPTGAAPQSAVAAGAPGSEPAESELLHLLRRALPGAREHSRRHMEHMACRVTRRPDEAFFFQGGPIPLTLVLRGHAAIRRTTPDGREMVLGIAKPGMLLGFSSIAASPSGVDLVAVTPTDVAVWSGDDIRAIVIDDAGLALDVIEHLSGYLVRLSDRLDGFIHQEARGRVLRVLAEHEDLFFGDPPVLSRMRLPGLVGTSREMTGRVLRGLERDGILTRVGRRGLRLLSPAGLDQLAGLDLLAGARRVDPPELKISGPPRSSGT